MSWFGKKNKVTGPTSEKAVKEQPTLMDNAATIAGYTNNPFATGIVLGRGHGKHKREQANGVGEVIIDEINTLTGGEKKK